VHNMSFREMRANNPAEKKVIGHDFGKKEERFKTDLRRDLDLEPDEVIIDHKLPDKKIKGAVDFGKD